MSTPSSNKFEDDEDIAGDFDSDDDDIETITGQRKDSQTLYRCKLDIGNCFHKFIVGKGAANLKRLQHETNTKIIVPGRNSRSSVVVVTGPTIRSIRSAKTQLRMCVQSALEKMDYTHFLSLPLINPDWKRNLGTMKRRMLKEMSRAAGLDESIFWKSNQFHITIAMLKIYDETTKHRVLEALKAASQDVDILIHRMVEKELNPIQTPHKSTQGNLSGYHMTCNEDGLLLRLGGLEYMNDDPSETHVVFVEIAHDKGREILLEICRILHNHLTERDLLDHRENARMFLSDGTTFQPKFHATVINTRLRRNKQNTVQHKISTKRLKQHKKHQHYTTTNSTSRSNDQNQHRGREKLSFADRTPLDATNLLQIFRNFQLVRKNVTITFLFLNCQFMKLF